MDEAQDSSPLLQQHSANEVRLSQDHICHDMYVPNELKVYYD